MNKNMAIVRFGMRIVLVVLLMGMVSASMAYDFSQVNSGGGQMLYYNIIDGTNHYVEITYPGSSTSNPWSYTTKPTGNLVLPNSVIYNGTFYTVTKIGDFAFKSCTGLTSLIIGSYVTVIGDNAFSGCSGLVGSLTIPDSVVSIGVEAFDNCHNLTGDLVIPNSVVSIGDRAFRDCMGFGGTLTLGSMVSYIGIGAFYNCNHLTGPLVIPNTINSINAYAFHSCSRLSGNLVLPESIISIGEYAFFYCQGFTGTLVIPSSVLLIGTAAFGGCSGLDGILVAYNNTSYDSRDNCNAIIDSNTNVLVAGCNNTIIPSSVISIGSYAFAYNTGLTSLVFGSSLTSIAEYAFYNCTNLTTMTVMNPTPPSIGSYCFYNVLNDILIFVPCRRAAEFHNTNGWNYFNNFQEMECVNYTITSTANPTEGGIIMGSGVYEEGSVCLLTAIANDGYAFVNWTENAEVVSTESSYSFEVNTNRELVANFALPFTITAVADPIIGGMVSGGGAYEYGTPCTLTATPNEGYVFLNWTKDDEVVSTNQHFSFIVTETGEYVAHFDLPSFMIRANCNPVEGGFIIFEGIQNNRESNYIRITDVNQLSLGNQIILAARYNEITNAYVAFSNTLTNGKLSVSEFTSQMNGDHEVVSADILADESNYYWNVGYTSGHYTFTNTNGDMIGYGNSGTNFVMGGEKTIWSIVPGVSGPESLVPNYFGFNIINDSATMRAMALRGLSSIVGAYAVPNINSSEYNFFLDVFVHDEGHGCVYTLGSTATLTAVPNEGYIFVNWTENGIEVSTNPEYSFTVNGGRNLQANFIEAYTVSVMINPENGGVVNGAGIYSPGSTCILNAIPNENYAFANWTINGNVITTSPTYGFVVNNNRTLVANFEEIIPTVEQSITLLSGWNWWAPTIQIELADLKTALGANGILVQSEASGLAEYVNGVWTGDLDSIVLGKMYRILVNADCTFLLYGQQATSFDTVIAEGYNWIGFCGTQPININELFGGDFEPYEGDKINSQNEGFAIYENGAWSGTLIELLPGHGYVYQSNDEQTKQINYQLSR